MKPINPFPDYPVISLDDDSGEVSSRTIPTPAIERSRTLTALFLEGWRRQLGDGEPASPMIVAVRGDYGSGKTHLLVDAEALILSAIGSSEPGRVSSALVPCIETDPIGWYRTTAASRFDLATIKLAVIHLFSLAGKDVARQVKLTQAAVARLEKEPAAIYELVKDNLLSASAVEAAFLGQLSVACPDAGSDTKAALGGLRWGETVDVAARWLCAEQLSEAERDLLGVSGNLDDDELAAEVMVAFAGLLSATGRLFVLMLDELEHLRRRDTVTGSKRNITWLKRLLQSLAANPVLVFVSGHWSAWEETSDYLERFSPDSTIDIHSLAGDDVLKIFSTRVPDANFEDKVASAIARAGGGNIRRILSLGRVLFEESDGFTKPVSERQIKEVAGRVSKRVSPQDALLKIHEVFEGEGFSVSRESEIGDGVRFPIVVRRGDQPEIVVEMKHSVTQQTLIKRLRRFVEQLTELRRRYPDLVGYFVSDGAGDPEVRSIVDSDQAEFIHFFDLATPSGLAALGDRARRYARQEKEAGAEAEELRNLLERSGRLEVELEEAQRTRDREVIARLEEQREQLNRSIREVVGEADKRDASLREQIERLERRRSAEFEELQNRLAELSSRFESTRDRELTAPQREEVGPRFHLAYEDMKGPLAQSTRLNALMGGSTLVALGLTLAMFVGAFALQYFAEQAGNEITELLNMKSSDLAGQARIEQLNAREQKLSDFASVARILCYGGSAALLWLLLSGWMKVDRFSEFRARCLRHVYLRSEDPDDLLKAEQLIHMSLAGGPLGAQRRAAERLSRGMPEIFGYLAEGGSSRADRPQASES